MVKFQSIGSALVWLFFFLPFLPILIDRKEALHDRSAVPLNNDVSSLACSRNKSMGNRLNVFLNCSSV